MQLEVVKLLKSRDVYEAKSEEASEKKACMKPTRHGASEKERALGAVYKRTQAGGKKKMKPEATLQPHLSREELSCL